MTSFERSFEQILAAEGFERLCRTLEQFAQALPAEAEARWFSTVIEPQFLEPQPVESEAIVEIEAATGSKTAPSEAASDFRSPPSTSGDFNSPAHIKGHGALDSAVLPVVRHVVLVIAHGFNALLIAEAVTAGYQSRLLFEPDAIRTWLQKLNHPALTELSQQPFAPPDLDLHSQFTLKLVECLALPTHCELTEAALRLQLEQERLLNQVTSQIRRSLDLPSILKTAVEQVRQFLQTDRLVIYQLNISTVKPIEFFELANPELEANQITTQYGSVIYESRSSETIPTVMNLSDAHCFVEQLRYQDWQDLDDAVAIDDVEIRYRKVPCLLEFLRRAQVRAKLVAPIWLQNQLWGLLIAHECEQPRHWQENERRFLQQIAQTLAIAIGQAQLYAEVQQQKQTLEERVVERTQALRDALLTAQTANRAKSEFLAMVSHELRTPLACIIGMSATLQRWSKDSLTERQQNFLQTIHESGEHLLTLINDILDLSQAEAGRMVLNVQLFSLASLARQTLKAFEVQAALQEVELELDLHRTALQESFSGDPRRIRQILFNLLSNAIKFTPAGGKVTLRLLAQPELAILQVQDTGIGIPETQLPLLFQKFQQLDSSYRREYQGTGLGLALTKQLVELHGGWIEVESTVGVGSLFTVKLPPQIAPQAKASLPPAPTMQRQRIVLVDPSEESASLICDLLLAADYQVVWVLEGLAALNQIEVLLPSAVMINVGLPDLDATHLIQSLRQNPVTQQIKVLALAAASQLEQQDNLARIQTLYASVDAVLVQPFHPEILLQKLKAL
jgi:two-component system, sensor histidine kinase and response regulator